MNRAPILFAAALCFGSGCLLDPPALQGDDCASSDDCAAGLRCEDGRCARAPTPDAGPAPDAGPGPFDAGAPEDAGPAPGLDAGAPDAGDAGDAGVDAGFDAGVIPCDDRVAAALDALCGACLPVTPAARVDSVQDLEALVAAVTTDAGPPDCWCVAGDLDLRSAALTDLSSLNEPAPLVGVTGTLRVDTGAPGLAGLEEVRVVGQDLELVGGALQALDADALERVGGRVLLDDLSLTDVVGLDALEEICGALDLGTIASAADISGFPNLRAVKDLTTETLNSLIDISGFPALERVDGDLELSALSSLQNVSGFPQLERVGGALNLAANPSLNTVAGFARLRRVDGELRFNTDGSLVSLVGLSSLQEVGGLVDFTGAASLPSLQGLEALVRAGGGIKLETMGSLVDLEPLAALEEVGGTFTIKNISSSAVLEGMDALRTVDTLRVEGTGLNEIRGWRRLQQVTTLLTLKGNANRSRCYADRLALLSSPPVTDIQNIIGSCSFLFDTFADDDLGTNPDPGLGFEPVAGVAEESGGIVDFTVGPGAPMVLAARTPDLLTPGVGLRVSLDVFAVNVVDGVTVELACVDPGLDPLDAQAPANPSSGVYARVLVTPAVAEVIAEVVSPSGTEIQRANIGGFAPLELEFAGGLATARVGGGTATVSVSEAALDPCRLILRADAVGGELSGQIAEVRAEVP